ncbi:hypothetical protein DIU36_17935 [Mucilaginibacter rubeus]|nr:hypothetical protein DIU36_17935 [Mucilaginibacter rubeus]
MLIVYVSNSNIEIIWQNKILQTGLTPMAENYQLSMGKNAPISLNLMAAFLIIVIYTVIHLYLNAPYRISVRFKA